MSLDKIDAFKYEYGNDINNDLRIYKYDDIAATLTVLNEVGELNFVRYIKFNNNYKKIFNEFCKQIWKRHFGLSFNCDSIMDYWKDVSGCWWGCHCDSCRNDYRDVLE